MVEERAMGCATRIYALAACALRPGRCGAPLRMEKGPKDWTVNQQSLILRLRHGGFIRLSLLKSSPTHGGAGKSMCRTRSIWHDLRCQPPWPFKAMQRCDNIITKSLPSPYKRNGQIHWFAQRQVAVFLGCLLSSDNDTTSC